MFGWPIHLRPRDHLLRRQFERVQLLESLPLPTLFNFQRTVFRVYETFQEFSDRLLGGGINLWPYVANNPIKRIDPLGLYDLWDLGEDILGFAAGLGNAVTFGGSAWIVEQFMSNEDAAVLRQTKRCSKSFEAGEWASLALGAGRLAYAGIAKGASMVYAARGATMANAAAASALRNALKQVFRLGLWRDVRIFTLEQLVERYGTAEAILAAAGRTNPIVNIVGAWATAGGATALAATDDCGCK